MDLLKERDRQNRDLEKRLSRLSQASLRINESLDFDTVLQEVVENARAPDRLELRGHYRPGRCRTDA